MTVSAACGDATVTTKVYLIRHGETDENRMRILQGQMDTALNATGYEQGRLLAAALRIVAFDEAFSSDLTRAKKTAQLILAHHPHLRLQEQQELRERMLGNLQGKQEECLRGGVIDDSVESMDLFTGRAMQWWNQKIAQRSPASTGSPRLVLVVTHGGFIRTLLQALLEKDMGFVENVVIGKCLNSSVTIIDVESCGRSRIVQYSDTAHLEP